MWNPLALLLAAVFGATLAGCGAPTAPAAMKLTPVAKVAAKAKAAEGVRVKLQVKKPAAYRTQAVVAAYTAADIDHVALAVYRAGALVTTVDVAAAALGDAVTIGNLRAGTAYDVVATAYADAAGTAVISAATGCTTSFTTPAVTTTNGVASVDDAAITLVSLALKLQDVTFAGTASLTVSVDSTFAGADAIDQVVVRVVTVAADGSETEKTRTTYALAAVDAGQAIALGQLRSGTTYKVYADGLRSADGTTASDASKSCVTFTTPSAAGGSADDAIGSVVVPLAL